MQNMEKVLFICCLVVVGVYSQTEEEELHERVKELTRLLMYHEEFMEERTRSDGDSGFKQIRISNVGRKTYQSEGMVDESVVRITDLPHTKDILGMGEFSAILNGIEFRAMTNDYPLRMPHRTDTTYHATEKVPFPDVPPEVTAKATVDEQVEELKLWFKAFANDDISTRDYRPYFKPVICYLEGAWVYANNSLSDTMPNADDMDASTFEELQKQNKFAAQAGLRRDNVPFLPTKVVNITESGEPVMAQWVYRTLCHPIDDTVYASHMRPVDDLAVRMNLDMTFDDYTKSSVARFQLNPLNRTNWSEQRVGHQWLDSIMEQVPGTDNYPGDLTDVSFELTAFSNDESKNGELLNTAYYHSRYEIGTTDAMGLSVRKRGFTDSGAFFAMTSQDEVVARTLNDCDRETGQDCKTYTQRWTYSFPLEIMYLTPLSKFNPYNLVYREGSDANLVTANGRNGSTDTSTAYDSISDNVFYQTPASFFSGSEVGPVTDDTLSGDVGVLDGSQNVQTVRASGLRTLLPSISGIDGNIRLRYPIMPYHEEGNSIFKEVVAFQDMVMKPITYSSIYNGEWVPSNV